MPKMQPVAKVLRETETLEFTKKENTAVVMNVMEQTLRLRFRVATYQVSNGLICNLRGQLDNHCRNISQL